MQREGRRVHALRNSERRGHTFNQEDPAGSSKYYIEVANMPTTNDALNRLMEQKQLNVNPGKAANLDVVATSALEMSRSSQRYNWSAQEVDTKLHGIMKNTHGSPAKAVEENGLGYNLVAGANIAGSIKVAGSMMPRERLNGITKSSAIVHTEFGLT